jgi:anti-anti-sigma factor
MKMTVLSDDKGLARLECEGNVVDIAGRRPLAELLGPSCYSRIVLLNLEKTDYMDSNGISWLITSHKRFKEAGGRLILHSLPPRILDMLKFLRLTTVLNCAADEHQARKLAATPNDSERPPEADAS